MKRALVIEDDDLKYADLVGLLRASLGQSLTIRRADTAVEAERAIDAGDWDLVLLDISMNISRGSLGPLRGGHANTGGLQIAERMYLYDQSFPLVIVTGFEHFKTIRRGRPEGELIGLATVERLAQRYFGPNFLGCVRYGAADWETNMLDVLKSVRQ